MRTAINRSTVPGLLVMLAACGGEQPPASGDSDAQSAAKPTSEQASAPMSEEAPATAENSQGRTFEVKLSGSGDEDGSGAATVTLEPNSGQVCYEISVQNIASPTAAHIHTGAAGETGGVAVPFNAPGGEGEWRDCVPADPAAVQQMIGNPSGYYVNVHNDPHPAGAVRGQLGDAPGS